MANAILSRQADASTVDLRPPYRSPKVLRAWDRRPTKALAPRSTNQKIMRRAGLRSGAVKVSNGRASNASMESHADRPCKRSRLEANMDVDGDLGVPAYSGTQWVKGSPVKKRKAAMRRSLKPDMPVHSEDVATIPEYRGKINQSYANDTEIASKEAGAIGDHISPDPPSSPATPVLSPAKFRFNFQNTTGDFFGSDETDSASPEGAVQATPSKRKVEILMDRISPTKRARNTELLNLRNPSDPQICPELMLKATSQSEETSSCEGFLPACQPGGGVEWEEHKPLKSIPHEISSLGSGAVVPQYIIDDRTIGVSSLGEAAKEDTSINYKDLEEITDNSWTSVAPIQEHGDSEQHQLLSENKPEVVDTIDTEREQRAVSPSSTLEGELLDTALVGLPSLTGQEHFGTSGTSLSLNLSTVHGMHRTAKAGVDSELSELSVHDQQPHNPARIARSFRLFDADSSEEASTGSLHDSWPSFEGQIEHEDLLGSIVPAYDEAEDDDSNCDETPDSPSQQLLQEVLLSPSKQRVLVQASPPRVYGQEKISFQADEDTTLLRDFLLRVQNKKADSEKRVEWEHYAEKRRSESPRKTSIIMDTPPRKDPSGPDNSSFMLAFRDSSKPSPSKQHETPTEQDIDDLGNGAYSEVTSSRRSRTPRTRASARSTTPSTILARHIQYRRLDGGDTLALPQSTANELALLTRNNTKSNRQGSKAVKFTLLALAKRASAEQGLAEIKVDNVAKGKGVHWDKKLTYFQLGEDSRAETSQTQEKAVSKPKIRRLKNLGAVNGTPAPKRAMQLATDDGSKSNSPHEKASSNEIESLDAVHKGTKDKPKDKGEALNPQTSSTKARHVNEKPKRTRTKPMLFSRQEEIEGPILPSCEGGMEMDLAATPKTTMKPSSETVKGTQESVHSFHSSLPLPGGKTLRQRRTRAKP